MPCSLVDLTYIACKKKKKKFSII